MNEGNENECSPSSSTPPTPPASSNEAVRKDLAALVRVRNRLAQTPDAKLPTVLKALLPRLLRRLNDNAAALLDFRRDRLSIASPSSSSKESMEEDDYGTRDEEAVTLRLEMQGHLIGTLSHAVERVRGNNSMPVLYVEPICEVLTELVSSPSLTLAWTLLETGVSHCDSIDAGTVIPSLVVCVDRLYGRIVADTAEPQQHRRQHQLQNNSAVEALLKEWNSACWMLLDAIALSGGLPALVDWDLQTFEPRSWDDLEGTVAGGKGATARVVLSGGAGFFNVLLDLLLFWPTAGGQHGISGAGEAWLRHRTHDGRIPWNEMHLRQLKYVALRYAIWPANQSIFSYGDTASGSGAGAASFPDRALLLSVLIASGGSAHGRVAANYVSQYDVSCKVKKRGATWTGGDGTTCSLALSCCLLVLVLGDEAAQPVLDRYSNEAEELCETLLGPRPEAGQAPSFLRRPPLPPDKATRAVDFVARHPCLGASHSALSESRVRLYVDLVVALQERHPGFHWGIQLIHGTYTQLRTLEKKYAEQVQEQEEKFNHPGNDKINVKGSSGDDKWIAAFHHRCLQRARSVLSELPEESNDFDGDDDGGRGPPGQRRDYERLLKRHRVGQKRRLLSQEGSIRAREVAYQLVRELSTELNQEATAAKERFSFELPILLFKCAPVEADSLQSEVTATLNHLLDSYVKLLAGTASGPFSSSSSMGVSENTWPHNLVTPLLPSFLCAVCSTSSTARLAAARWSGEFLSLLDPPASNFICRFLSDDPDASVSSVAKAALSKSRLTSPRGCAEKNEKTTGGIHLVEFLHSQNTQDMDMVRADLRSRLDEVSNDAGVPTGVAAVLLNDCGFVTGNAKKAALVIVGGDGDRDRERGPATATPERCGLNFRLGGRDKMEVDCLVEKGRFCCPVCYEEVDCTGTDTDAYYAMPCGHAFCAACWRSYLSSQFQNATDAGILATACPRHDCRERVVMEEIQKLSPAMVPRWENALLSRFLQEGNSYRPCPGPECPLMAHLPEQMPQHQAISCRDCKTEFCFGCGNPPHAPARCWEVEAWNRILGNSSFWIAKNAKPCPTCRVPIEKNQGCNHMHCSQCGAHFCWLCLQLLDQAHTCNLYDPADHAENEGERRALFYSDRYQAHETAQAFAEKGMREMQEEETNAASVAMTATSPASLTRQPWFRDDDTWLETLFEAQKTLVLARRFLKHSYVTVWAMTDEDARLTSYRDAFVSHQATLELMTERLDRLVRVRVDPIYRDQGNYGVRWHFRAINFHSASVENFMLRMQCLEEQERILSELEPV